MKHYIYNTIFLFFMGISVFGQLPNWTVNENDYEHTMSFVAFLNIGGNDLSNSNDQVAAFVNGVCRGVTNLTYNSDKESYYAYLTVFANKSGETITFKMYDSVSNTVTDAVQSQNFEIDQHYGNLFQAYSIASPALQTDTEIVDFSFSNVDIISKTIFNGEINIVVDQNVDIPSLVAQFELSTGAEAFNKTTSIISGQNTLDFSNPVTLQVRSEDQSTLQEWVITVMQSSGTVIFFKMDAVCYNNGAIKVIFNTDNTVVTLQKEGEFYATQTIRNGETIFRDLEIGSYNVTVSGNNKEINIIQKQ